MSFPDNMWYIPELPLKMCTFVAPPRTQQVPWFTALVADIKKRGLKSPILVWNTKEKPYYIRCGNNRVEALVQLLWTHAPALSFGDEPDADLKPEKLHSLKECQDLLGDGIIGYQSLNNRDQFLISSAKVPEHMKYPD